MTSPPSRPLCMECIALMVEKSKLEESLSAAHVKLGYYMGLLVSRLPAIPKFVALEGRDATYGKTIACHAVDPMRMEDILNEHQAMQQAIVRWVRADRAWTLCQGSDPAVQDEMDQATYALHSIADEVEGR